MFNWLRELREVWNEPKPCQSCEVLRIELANANIEKQRLLNHILTPQPVIVERTEAPEPQVPIKALSHHISWRIKQQMLEQASRERAEALGIFNQREAAARKVHSQPITPASTTEELEKTLGIVEGSDARG